MMVLLRVFEVAFHASTCIGFYAGVCVYACSLSIFVGSYRAAVVPFWCRICAIYRMPWQARSTTQCGGGCCNCLWCRMHQADKQGRAWRLGCIAATSVTTSRVNAVVISIAVTLLSSAALKCCKALCICTSRSYASSRHGWGVFASVGQLPGAAALPAKGCSSAAEVSAMPPCDDCCALLD